jgi:hypothetical protein
MTGKGLEAMGIAYRPLPLASGLSDEEGDVMKRMEESSLLLFMAGGVFWPHAALAEEAAKAPGSYGSTDYVWFTVIAGILIYGVYDTFFKTP